MSTLNDNRECDESEIIIHKEEDIPFQDAHDMEKQMPGTDVANLERMAGVYQKVHGLSLKNRAFTLIIILIILLCVLYGTDVILKCNNLPNSELLNGIFEFLKITLSTLIGFTFSTKIHEKE